MGASVQNATDFMHILVHGARSKPARRSRPSSIVIFHKYTMNTVQTKVRIEEVKDKVQAGYGV
jgi:hypothetical protein